MAAPLVSLYEPPFHGVDDLTQHIFDKRGVELSTVRRMIFVGNVEGLVESICILLDQHNADDTLIPGTKYTRSTCEESLGINRGYIPIDHIYSGLFYFLCQGNHLDIIDIFRILRSRKDWTSSSFREAMKNSEFRKYRITLYEEYSHIPRSMYYHYLLSKIFELTFDPSSGDFYWMWITPPINPETGELNYEAISTPNKEVYDEMLNELNARLIDSFYYSGNATAMKYYFDPRNHRLNPNAKPRDVYDRTFGLNYVPHPSILNIVIARRYFTSYLFVPYYRQMAEQLSQEMEALSNELTTTSSRPTSAASTASSACDLDDVMSSMIQVDPKIQQEKINHYAKLIASYKQGAENHLEFFKQFVQLFGIDVCYTHDINAVLIAAQFDHDHEIITLLQSFNIDLQIVNSYQFTHTRHRAPLMTNRSLLAMVLEARKDEGHTVIVANILLMFSLYNLTSFVTRVLSEPQNKGITLSELSRKHVNFLTLACESPTVTFDTVKFLLSHRCKIYSNSKSSNKNNVFLALFMSRYSCPREREKIASHILNITRKSSDYMPALTVEEWISVLRSISYRRIFTLESYSSIIALATDLVPRDVMTMMQSNPPVYLRHINEGLSFSYFSATLDIFSFPPFFYDIWQKDMLSTMQALFPPEHGQALCTALAQTGEVITFLINTRATDALQYLLRIGYIPTTGDMKTLAISNGFVVDPHDCNFGHLLKQSRDQWWDRLMPGTPKLKQQFYLPNLQSIEIHRIAFSLDCDYYFTSDHERSAHELYTGRDAQKQNEVVHYAQRQYNIQSHYTEPYSISQAIAETFSKKDAHADARESKQSDSVKPLLTADEDDLASVFLSKIISTFEDDHLIKYNQHKARQTKWAMTSSAMNLPGAPRILREDQVDQGPLGLGHHYEHGYSTFMQCFYLMRRSYPDFDIAAPIILPKIGLEGGNYLLLYIYSLAYPDLLCDKNASKSLAKVFVRHSNSTMLYSQLIIVELIVNHIILHFDSSPEMLHLIETRQYDQITITPHMHEQLINFILINFNHFMAEACRTKDFGFGSYSFFQFFFERTRWMPLIFLKRVFSPDTAMITQDGGIFLNILDQYVALHGSASLFVEEYHQCSQPLRWLAMVLLNGSVTDSQRRVLSNIIGYPLELSDLAHYLGLPSAKKQILKGGAILATVGAIAATAWYLIKNHIPNASTRESILSSLSSYVTGLWTSSPSSSSSSDGDASGDTDHSSAHEPVVDYSQEQDYSYRRY